jgi:hypothetical protein
MLGIPSYHLSQTKLGADADVDLPIVEALRGCGAELVVLGYRRKLGPRTLGSYRSRILNIHPALLPRHGGRGMYGRRVHEAVIAAGERTSGITIHLVDEEYDCGRCWRGGRCRLTSTTRRRRSPCASRLWSHNFSSRRYGVSPTERSSCRHCKSQARLEWLLSAVVPITFSSCSFVPIAGSGGKWRGCDVVAL